MKKFAGLLSFIAFGLLSGVLYFAVAPASGPGPIPFNPTFGTAVPTSPPDATNQLYFQTPGYNGYVYNPGTHAWNQYSTGGTFACSAAMGQLLYSVTGTDCTGFTAAGDLTFSQPNFTLAASGVTAGTYGDATDIPKITVDAKGRITTATTVPFSAGNVIISPATGNTVGDLLSMSNTTTGVQDSGVPIASLAPVTRFTPSSGGSRIPFTEATATRRGTSQGGLTYTINEHIAWSLYLANGTGHAQSVAGWTIPCATVGTSCSSFDVAFAASWICPEGSATGWGTLGIVIGMSDGTGVDAAFTDPTGPANFATFVAGTVANITPIVNVRSFGASGVSAPSNLPYPLFVRIKSDGTNIYNYDSNDGVTWHLWAEWAISSKIVSGAYTSVYIGMANTNGNSGGNFDEQFVLYMVDTAPASRTSTSLRPY